jgi:hypothetical protein
MTKTQVAFESRLPGVICNAAAVGSLHMVSVRMAADDPVLRAAADGAAP